MGRKLGVLRTSFVTHIPQVTLNVAAVIYGVFGLLLDHTLSAIPPAFTASRPRKQRTA